MTVPSDLELTALAALVAARRDDEAFTRLVRRLAWPRGRQLEPKELGVYLDLLGTIAARRDGHALAALATAAAGDLDSPDRLYDLGYALIDAGVPAIAATMLWRCLVLVPDSEEVVCELVSALESMLAYGDALAVLEKHEALRSRSFLCRYLYAFNAAMTGQLALTREALPLLAPQTPDTIVMHGAIAAIVDRAARVTPALPLDGTDLRGWHYVLSGGLLVHQSPFGFDDPMHGRYAWLADSLARIATGIGQLVALCAALPTPPPCVYAPPGRGHAIVAHAIAARLGIEVAPWPAVGVPAPGIVALYDLADLAPPDVARLVTRRPDQILFAHASPWTIDSPVAPDVTTLLYQTLVAPWDASTIIDPETREASKSPPDERPIETIAAELAAHAGLRDDELAVDAAADQVARWHALVARAWPPTPGPRARLWAGGPVPSNRFE